eukprot:1897241-Amphidinium_carterae.1
MCRASTCLLGNVHCHVAEALCGSWRHLVQASGMRTLSTVPMRQRPTLLGSKAVLVCSPALHLEMCGSFLTNDLARFAEVWLP